MRTLLRSLKPALEVRPSSSHGRNDCLTDSILLAMEDQGLIRSLDIDMRVQLCTAVRRHLVLACDLSPHSYPFLSHDEHFEAICQVLRESLLPLWLAEQCPSQTSLTCIVYDRFNRLMVKDVSGKGVELIETNPVHSAAPGAESLSAVVTLYCNTHDNGEGWHYEWIRACDEAHAGSGNPAPVTPDQRSSRFPLPLMQNDSDSEGSWIHGCEEAHSDSEILASSSSDDVTARSHARSRPDSAAPLLQAPVTPPAPPTVPSEHSLTSRSTSAFCTPWFQDNHASNDACSGCADPEWESAAPGEQPAPRSWKRRRIVRRGIPENEFGELILPDPPIDYILYDGEEETDCTTSSASSTGEDADNVAANLAYPLPVKLLGGQAVERDQLMQCSQELSDYLRVRPTLPASTENYEVSFTDVETAIRLPLFSCPFRGCAYATDERAAFLRHLASPTETFGHYALVRNLCGRHFSIASPLDFVYSAISIIERRQIPCIGMATTRRALRRLTKVYNDDAIKALVCFVCGEIHCTMRGPDPL